MTLQFQTLYQYPSKILNTIFKITVKKNISKLKDIILKIKVRILLVLIRVISYSAVYRL